MSTMDTVEIPEEYLCPISMDIMTDPVIASDGQTYNRPALLQWLQVRQISPLTNQPITNSGIVTNYALRAAIERWMAQNQGRQISAGPAPAKSRPMPRFKLSGSADPSVKWLSYDGPADPMEVIEILVLDNSGSMGGSAARTRSVEGGDYSRLDLVRHASRTVGAMLAERTTQGTPAYLSIISYSNSAKIIMPVRKMTPDVLDDTFAKLDTIQPEGSTNIWDGLRLALDTAARAAHMHPDAVISIRLLTDGEPTESLNPPTGIVGALTRKLATMPNVNLNISAFGFGYSLDDSLLREICQVGGSIFGYIPDCSMVATVFINAVANSLASVARNIKITWEDGSVTHIPNMTMGRDVSLLTSNKKGRLTVVNSDEAQDIMETEQKGDGDTFFEAACNDVQSQIAQYFNGTITPAQLTDSLCAVHQRLKGVSSSAAKDLADDIQHDDPNKGQLMKALSRLDWLTDWGRNHLIAYMRALQTQQCVNFKDAAPQQFLSDEVRRLREMGNLLFNNLPAPKPSLVSYAGGAAGAAPINMAVFNNANGGCWAGNCLVRLGDDTYCYANEVEAGNFLWGGHRVVCVVRTVYDEPIQMCKLGGLSITPWHPVQNKNDKECRWYFPADLVAKGVVGHAVREMVRYTYNYVLESGHTVEIDSYKACTLGHYMEGDVIGHEYFGTRRVIDDLKNQPGWGYGLVTIKPTQWIRGEDGRVCGLRNGEAYRG